MEVIHSFVSWFSHVLIYQYHSLILYLYDVIFSGHKRLGHLRCISLHKTNSSSIPYLFLHSHIIFLFHDCPSWNYINILIIFWNCEPDGGESGSYFLKKIQTGRPHQVLNPGDRKILKFAVDSPPNPKSTTLIINITY